MTETATTAVVMTAAQMAERVGGTPGDIILASIIIGIALIINDMMSG